MKMNTILPILLLGLGISNAPTPSIMKASDTQITSFTDFIATDDELKNYYGDVKYLVGEDLIQNLEKTIEKDNKKLNYSGEIGPLGSWGTYALADRDFAKSDLTKDEIIKVNSSNPGVWWKGSDIYCNVMYEETPFKFTGSSKVNGKFALNREHVYPKSHGFNGNDDLYSKIMAGCDIHNLHMAEAAANKLHSNYPYGEIVSTKEKSCNSIITGKTNGYIGTSKNNINPTFEPIDKDKGEIARSIFYMATRYHTYDSNVPNDPRLVLGNSGFNTSTKSPDYTKTHDVVYGILDDLIEWNAKDTVNDIERIRNSVIYKFLQNNRNPYSDFPKWADVAFNKDTKYYADISKPEGVGLIFDLANPNIIKDTYYKDEIVDTSTISFKYLENKTLKDLTFSDVTASLKNINTGKITDITNTDNIKFDSIGKYELTFTYSKSNYPITTTFEVLPPRGNYINFSVPLYEEYIKGETLDISAKKITTTINGNTVLLEPTDSKLTYELKNKTLDKTYDFTPLTPFDLNELGDYVFTITYTNLEDILTNVISFKVIDFKDSVTINGLDYLEGNHYVNDKFNMNNVEYTYKQSGTTKTINKNDVLYEVINKNGESSGVIKGHQINNYSIKENDEILKITIKHPESLGTYVLDINLNILNPIDSIVINGIDSIKSNYYEDDILGLDNISATYHYNGKVYTKKYNELKFILVNTETNTEKTVYRTTNLDIGTYDLYVEVNYPTSNQPIRKEIKKSIVVSDLLDSVETNAKFEETYKIGSVLDFSNITFSYIQDGQKFDLDSSDLDIKLEHVDTGRIITISADTYTLEKPGAYNLTISYQTYNKKDLVKTYGFKVEEKSFTPEADENDLTLLIVVGVSSVILLIVASIIITVVAKKKKK